MTKTKYDLVLYHFSSCPYCVMVHNFISEHNLTIPAKDTLKDPSARDELISIGGKGQVPCLVIDGNPLYESLDIIDWLKQNLL
jgi:glutaredoxin